MSGRAAIEAAVRRAAQFIAAQQTAAGAIPWFAGGALDPWDHVECAMALDVAGRHADAERAYRWLIERQLPDGAFWAKYAGDAPHDRLEETKDSNVSSYLAVGVWHHYRAGGDRRFLRTAWPAVQAVIDFALSLQGEHGGIHWARDGRDNVWPDVLVAGSSSVRAAVLCAERIAAALDLEPPEHWRPRRHALEEALRDREGEFGGTFEEDTASYAMHWYYPVLCGVLSGAVARERLDGGWERWVRPDRGALCTSDKQWVTIAESSELALALDACGRGERARELLSWQLPHQDGDGGFPTGTVDGYGAWPDGERPTWTAAAVVLAADALYGLSPAGDLFRSLQDE